MLLLRLVPTPLPALNYLFGATGINPRAYVLATILGYLPGTAAVVLGGNVGTKLITGKTDAPAWVYIAGLSTAAAVAVTVAEYLRALARELYGEMPGRDEPSDEQSAGPA